METALLGMTLTDVSVRGTENDKLEKLLITATLHYI